LFVLLLVFSSGCTQIVTAPIGVAGKVVITTIDIAGAAGSAVVNMVRGENKK